MVGVANARGLGVCASRGDIPRKRRSQCKDAEVSERQHIQETGAVRGKRRSWKKSDKARLHCFAKEHGLKGQDKNSKGF